MPCLLENGKISWGEFRQKLLQIFSILFCCRYFEFEVLTSGPMRVGWARADAKAGYQLGQDDCSWAFDGWRVRALHVV